MTSTLEGTVALVTGASSGIGEATAQRLAQLGATVAVLARRADRLDDLVTRIVEGGGRAVAHPVDVSDADALRETVQRVASDLGRLDVVVANAGVMLLGPILDAPVQEWETMLDVNLRGLLHTAHATLPHLLDAAQQDPRQVADLVLVSSVAGRVPRNGSGVYNLTKHGVGAFGESLRQEVTRRHVRVGLIEPGAVATELAGHNRPEVQETMAKRFANMERMVAEDIADAIEYMVTRPRRTAVNEILIRPTEQDN